MKEYFDKLYKHSKEEFYNQVNNFLINEQKKFIVTANPETLMIAENNSDFKKALLDDETIIIADGIGVVKGAKMLDYSIKETIPGIELCSKLFQYCNELEKSIFLFGAKEEIVKKLVDVINTKYPKVKVCGYENGYVEDKQKIFEKISLLKPDVVLVALGIPHQELLIYNNLSKFNKGIFVGVGGSFDVLSGTKKRAPKLFRKLHLEWLYRIMKEPKRFKRFFSSNVKYLFKLLHTNILDILFIGILILFLCFGLIKTVFFQKNINYYENRPAYKLPDISMSDFLDGSFQDNIELALSDQIFFAQSMKKYYNMSNNYLNKTIVNLLFKDYYYSKYIYLNGIYKYGPDDNFVYPQRFLENETEDLDVRINDLNNAIEKYQDLDFYVYYVEKDTDINFITNNRSGISDYLEENLILSKENFGAFKINSFDDFKENFYKTDHHWNHAGSYKAYCEILKLIKENDNPVDIKDTVCLSKKFSGSKASLSGYVDLYREPFYAHVFDLTPHDTYINGEKSEYGHNSDIYNINPDLVSYGGVYGSDYGEVVFDYNNPSAENILIFGESYDNAVIELIASHFNKTYSVDLRAYEMDAGHKFEFDAYIEENDISIVLSIGNIDFYVMDEFLLEV